MAVSVVVDDLTVELGLDSVALVGFLTAYAPVQPAMGPLRDKAGPGRVSAIALVVAAAATLMGAAPLAWLTVLVD